MTLVFRDNVDIYWARQQVSQQMKEAEEQIPSGAGKVSLAPISTGLGEIYQYTIHPKKGYEKKFTLTDIRTVQDWIVRKQFAGTEGVAEVNGWGGYVKQYEVAINSDRLASFGLTVSDLYNAIEKNNKNTGGSYIEQGNNQYFIRGIGLAHTLEDIRQIPVKTVNSIPVHVEDVADVRFGTAMRYGAVTRNGEGEVVSGITLMLKGENFQQVMKNVKARMAQIQKTLPKGLVIEPFIDRTQLVDRVTVTISRNLVEGLLIVMFILVLFLGNTRAELKLPVEYHYTYGGQFENLKEAKSKLSVAVPIALVIILFLLFFTLICDWRCRMTYIREVSSLFCAIDKRWHRAMEMLIKTGEKPR